MGCELRKPAAGYTFQPDDDDDCDDTRDAEEDPEDDDDDEGQDGHFDEDGKTCVA